MTLLIGLLLTALCRYNDNNDDNNNDNDDDTMSNDSIKDDTTTIVTNNSNNNKFIITAGTMCNIHLILFWRYCLFQEIVG